MSTVLAKSNETSGIERRNVDPLSEWEAMRQQAKSLVASGFLPRAINTPEKAIAVMQTGRELGIGPMQALRCIHIIDGKPCMAAELIAGLALSRIPGSTLRPIENTDRICTVEAARPGQSVVKFTFTIEDASKAGLTSKDNWRMYPRAMLRSRAITEAARAVFPDATMGLYDPDELGAITSATGEVVEMPAPTVTEVRDAPVQQDWHSQITACRTLDELKYVWGQIPSDDKRRGGLSKHKDAKKRLLEQPVDEEREAIQEAEGEVLQAQFDE